MSIIVNDPLPTEPFASLPKRWSPVDIYREAGMRFLKHSICSATSGTDLVRSFPAWHYPCRLSRNIHAQMSFQGEFFDKDDPSDVPFLPHALPNPRGAPRMLTLWVSAYIINTFAYVTETRGLLRYTVTNDDVRL